MMVGVEFDRSTFTVVTPGVEFLQDVTGSGTITLSNGQEAEVEWSEALQGFVATAFTASPDSESDICTTKTATAYDSNHSAAQWTVTNPCEDGSSSRLNLPTRISTSSPNGFYAWEHHIAFR